MITNAVDFFHSLQLKTEQISYIYTAVDAFVEGKGFECVKETALEDLHANFVKMPNGKSFIASQLPQTTEKARVDFWKKVFHHSSLIVDLTTKNETHKKEEPLNYYPLLVGQKLVFQYEDKEKPDVEIDFKKVEMIINGKVPLLTYEVTVEGVKKMIQRIHFFEWPKFKGIEIELVDGLMFEIENRIKKSIPWIHCMGGWGRTGTLITLLALRSLPLETLKQEPEKEIEKTILQGRVARGPRFIETPSQLETVIEYVKLMIA